MEAMRPCGAFLFQGGSMASTRTVQERLSSAKKTLEEQKDVIWEVMGRLSYIRWDISAAVSDMDGCADIFEVDRVIFNGPVTVIVWKDGSKTKTRCQDGDVYSRETGFLMCVAKRVFPNWRDVMAKHVWGQE